MMLTTIAARAHGIDSLRMIHDSFATHACDAPVLSKVLREEFVRMYETDVIAQFANANLGGVSAEARLETGAIPTRGSFRLDEVLRSPYFFC
jgi:DNA-directed RNA polymerase